MPLVFENPNTQQNWNLANLLLITMVKNGDGGIVEVASRITNADFSEIAVIAEKIGMSEISEYFKSRS